MHLLITVNVTTFIAFLPSCADYSECFLEQQLITVNVSQVMQRIRQFKALDSFRLLITVNEQLITVNVALLFNIFTARC